MYALKKRLHEREKAHRSGELRTIALDVTSKCNMRCAHCYAAPFDNVQHLELDVLERVLDEAYEMGVFHYVLQGGEPTVDPERLESIIRMVRPEETYINVVSNGWNMTRQRIQWLKGLQVDKITFSMDSGLEHEHDANRVDGAFQRVTAAIDNVLDEGLLSSISTVVTHRSLYSEGFEAAYRFALQKGIRMDVQIAMPVGKWDGCKDLLITEEDARYIRDLREKSPTLSNGLTMINRDLYRGKYDHCPAGTEFLAITANGNLLPCNFLQHSLGNVRDKTITEMRASLLQNRWFSESQPKCLGGEDDEFIDAFIMPYVNQTKPLDAFMVYGLPKG